MLTYQIVNFLVVVATTFAGLIVTFLGVLGVIPAGPAVISAWICSLGLLIAILADVLGNTALKASNDSSVVLVVGGLTVSLLVIVTLLIFIAAIPRA